MLIESKDGVHFTGLGERGDIGPMHGVGQDLCAV